MKILNYPTSFLIIIYLILEQIYMPYISLSQLAVLSPSLICASPSDLPFPLHAISPPSIYPSPLSRAFDALSLSHPQHASPFEQNFHQTPSLSPLLPPDNSEIIERQWQQEGPI